LPAGAVEGFVLEQLRIFAADPVAWKEALGSTLAQNRTLLAKKEAEIHTLDEELARVRAAYRKASPAQRVASSRPSGSWAAPPTAAPSTMRGTGPGSAPPGPGAFADAARR
jgi:hypothetical protein